MKTYIYVELIESESVKEFERLKLFFDPNTDLDLSVLLCDEIDRVRVKLYNFKIDGLLHPVGVIEFEFNNSEETISSVIELCYQIANEFKLKQIHRGQMDRRDYALPY